MAMTPPVLWLDVTETLESGMRTGIQRVTIELARELLSQSRGRLIRLDRSTRDFAVLTDPECASLFRPPTGSPAIPFWHRWAARWGLVPLLGRFKDGLLRLSLGKAQKSSFDWKGGVYLTAEILGNLARYEAVRRLPPTVPRVLMFHDLFPLTAPEYSALRARAFARHWQLAIDAVKLVSVSQHTSDEALVYAASQGQSLPPLTVCHPGHSLGNQEAVAPASLPPPGYFLCVGTLEHRKNQAGLLAAYLQYRQEGGKTPLVITGRPGPGSEALVKSIQQASTQGVFWYQNAEDAALAWLYRNALALVYPSRAEGFGLPLVEALALGIPCLTSSRTSTAEVAELCGGCLQIDPEDVAALTAGMARFDEPGFRDALVKTIRHAQIPTWAGFFAGVDRVCQS